MKEAEWLACGDPRAMLRFLRGKVSERKLRLFACSFARERISCEGGEDALQGWATAVGTAEQMADGEPCGELGGLAKFYVCMPSAWRAAEEGSVEFVMDRGGKNGSHYQRFLVQTFREIFGNPFRPVTFSPSWRTSDVLLLARGIYAEKAFDRMPILADALQDAGCDSEPILDHLRDPHATHVRGCWALDLVLDKS
jgi:hypothetical protein